MNRCVNYKELIITVVLIVLCSASHAQEYRVGAIPVNLKNNANAVVREHSQLFAQSDINNGTYKVHKVITVFNEKGSRYAHFHEYGDKFREITSFSGTLRDASGKIIRKIKKGDLTTTSISDEHTFASDNYSVIYECQSPTYPYTVEYDYQAKWKNGILVYPPFAPFEGYNLAIEKAEYKIEIPKEIKFRYRESYKSGLRQEISADKNSYVITLNQKEAIPYEPLSPSYKEVFPHVLMSPGDFCYDSSCGNMENWTNYGLWVSNLLKDKDLLPPDFVANIRNMVKDAPTTREKVRILYNYLQQNSRYVSVQLGIGGYQPAPAAFVAKNRLGDCKGLTNLMKAMLKAVDIPSNYCVISMSEKELYRDFPNFSQADHVILLVPQRNDSIWLECTSQTLPFGYVHQDIAGHDVLVISESGPGGTLCKMPAYTDAQNCKKTSLNISVNEDGSAYGDISISESLSGYERVYRTFRSKERKELTDYINANMRIPQVQTKDIHTGEDLSGLPSALMTSNFETKDFANRTGSRLFIPICPLKKTNFNVFSSSERSLDIVVSAGFSESDSIVIDIPDSFGIESLPKDILLQTPFGKLTTKAEKKNNKIIYTQYIDISAGKYDKDQYRDIKDFFAQITSAVKRNLVLRKE